MMLQIILKRLLIMVVKFLILTIIVFTFGTAVCMSREFCFIYETPTPASYWRWITAGLIHGDFGLTMVQGWAVLPTPVLEMIGLRLPNTLRLLGLTLILVYGLGIPLGIMSGRYSEKVRGRLIQGIGILGVSIPPFVLSMFFLRHFALRNGWFPWRGSLPIGMEREAVSFVTYQLTLLHHLILPALSMALVMLVIPMKYLASSILKVKNEIYVILARAKGASERRLIKRHILKNANTSLISSIPLQIASIISASIIIEELFALPGIARLFFQSFVYSEIELMKAIILLLGGIVLIVSFITDTVLVLKNPQLTK